MATTRIEIVETKDEMLKSLLQELAQHRMWSTRRGQGFITKIEHIYNHSTYRYRIYYRYADGGASNGTDYEHLIQQGGVC